MEYQCIPIKSSHYMALCLLELEGNIILQPNPAWWAVPDKKKKKSVMWFTIKNMF